MTLTNKGYIPRLMDPQIDLMMRSYGAVSIEGTKYCGKTWTALNHANSLYALDDPTLQFRNLRYAEMDVNYALEGKEPRLIDEWQLSPGIWDGVRRKVDEDNRKGRFILCGSSTPNDEDNSVGNGIKHSGFGRIGTVRLRTMSLFESGSSDGRVSLSGLFNSEFKPTPIKDMRLEDLITMTMRGGWPGNLNMSDEDAFNAVSRYPDFICEKDLKRVDRSKNPSRMKMLLRSLARNESTMVSMSTISKDILENDDENIKGSTIADYIDTLSRMFLIEDQMPFSPNLRSSVRVGKTPKRHLTDPALAVASLGLSKKMLEDDLNTFGFMFESLCERDLGVYATANGGRLMHYRDGSGREIDAVVEMPDGRWGAFEVKLGTNMIDSAADNLIKIGNMMADDPNGRAPEFMCVISGMESAAYRREDGVYVVPITSLRN